MGIINLCYYNVLDINTKIAIEDQLQCLSPSRVEIKSNKQFDLFSDVFQISDDTSKASGQVMLLTENIQARNIAKFSKRVNDFLLDYAYSIEGKDRIANLSNADFTFLLKVQALLNSAAVLLIRNYVISIRWEYAA